MQQLEFDEVLPLEKRLLVNYSEKKTSSQSTEFPVKPIIKRPEPTPLFKRLESFLPQIRELNQELIQKKQKNQLIIEKN
ncbi:hypothetical protein PNEG_01608 [Pneumocystis murina B123]|uniref:Uncharacterized protein n=1 Tax=Pneumocystis murina (strain B123) TaxID=1069680 RepID=M7P940_PNEMU|nr:hypothetical protein PNEG_01608 [Pneumocystis murina B123]EMR10355.1 hypothetical protein PNEG_01608 [Pneumocystis murina B123]